MKPRHLIALAGLALLAALPAQADRISLSQISSYLNGIRTLEAAFTQVNADGSISTGTLYILRPGRVRFEYAPPDRTLVLAGGGQVAIFDGKSNQPPEQYPLSKTPLNLILAPDIDLGRARMVVGHTDDGKTTSVVAQDPDHPERGTIRLVFSDDPVQLRQWIITDETGGKTTVILGKTETGGQIPSARFSITAETQRRGL